MTTKYSKRHSKSTTKTIKISVAIVALTLGLFLIQHFAISRAQTDLKSPKVKNLRYQINDQRGTLQDDDVEQLYYAIPDNITIKTDNAQVSDVSDKNRTMTVKDGYSTYKIGLDYQGFGHILWEDNRTKYANYAVKGIGFLMTLIGAILLILAF